MLAILMVDRLMAFQGVHILILRTCGYVILHGRKAFASVIILRWGRLDYPKLSRRYKVITESLRGVRNVSVRKRDKITEAKD